MKAYLPAQILRSGLPARFLFSLLPSISAEPTPTPAPTANGQIAFSHLEQFTTDFEIYSMDPNGTNQINLTNHAGHDVDPAWSPNGARIAWASNREGNYQIYVMNPDGSGSERLTNNSASDSSPAWSPGSSRILFQSNRDGNNEIYVMNADGSNQIRLTNNAADDHHPRWAFNGSKIAFTSDRDGNKEIYVMNFDGSNPIRLTNNAFEDDAPTWSPDSTKIAFYSARDGNFEIYSMNVDGSNQTRLTNHIGTDWSPEWSPDGTKIAFESQRDTNFEIYVMDADGSNPTNLTHNQDDADESPSWQRTFGSTTPTPSPVPGCTPLPSAMQEFDDITTLVPAGWFIQNQSQPGPGTTGWFQGNSAVFPSQSGNPNSYIAANYNNGIGTSTLSNWLLTPTMTVGDGAGLAFWTRTVDSPTFADRLQVRLSRNGASTNVGASATDVGDFTELLLDINPSYTKGAYPNQWTFFQVIVHHDITMPFTGRFAFRYFVENGGPSGVNSDYIGIDSVIIGPGCGGAILPTPTPAPETPTPTPGPPTPTASPTPIPSATPLGCQVAVTQSVSQTITPGNSNSCNAGSPDFFHAETSYWRSFALGQLSPETLRVIHFVSFGIEKATANPEIGTQPVTVRLHAQKDGVFPAGTWTQFASVTVNIPNQTGTILSVPMSFVVVPPEATRLIVEVFTPEGRSPVNNSFVIGSNAAGQNAPGYMSAPFCGLTTPTDLATIGHPNMHMVFNLTQSCIFGDPTPTPIPTSPTPTPTPVTPTPTPSPSSTPTPSPSPSVTPTPSGTPTRAINLSTRMNIQTGDSVAIGGFIITGTAPKQVLLRAIGPSLGSSGVANPLADPFMELHGPNGFVTLTNDNWRDPFEIFIAATGAAPTNDLESAILATLDPGAYTAIVTGKESGTGVGLVEVYDLSQTGDSKLANLSTRAQVGTSENVVIAGFLLGGNGGLDKVIVRGIGPSLAPGTFPVEAVLADPQLELRDADGTLVLADNDWQDDAGQAAEISAAGLAPTNSHESAIAATLQPGAYTALLLGGTGLAVVEIYDLGP